MFRFLFVLIMFLVATDVFSAKEISISSQNEISDKVFNALIVELETTLILPNRAYQLNEYTRHYAFKKVKNTEYVFAVYVFKRAKKGGIVITTFNKLPIIFDGGCSVIELKYSLHQKKIDSLFCHGEA